MYKPIIDPTAVNIPESIDALYPKVGAKKIPEDIFPPKKTKIKAQIIIKK